MCTINIIGCGKVGKTLGRLFVRQGLARIGDVLNRSLESSREAVAFLGEGQAVTGFAELHPADIHLVSTSDSHIADAAGNLVRCGVVRRGDVVFHCSGSLSSAVLSSLRPSGAVLGSVHPVKSFADPERSVASFAGTFCGMEGDEKAQALLTELFTGIGGKVFPVAAENKMIYHAATVLVCNYLTVLVELACRCLLKAGLEEETALHMMEPLALETVANIFRDGTVRALTGPVSRGEREIVAGQLEALSRWEPEMGEAYRLLGKVALELALKKGAAPRELLMDMEKLLDGDLGNG
ncbi:MAG: DUF2520 domain-containing protein [Desulfuromonadaceae bacterium]|nr:DUF2520 domain-containing protein [Desulfuromonadaceae bacterium]